MNALSFDLFCRVVDNFGDAGVCWRLARRLAALGQPVRLWIDQPGILARLVPALDAGAQEQTLDGVRVGTWRGAERAAPPRGGVVVEAFACALPPAYQDAMTGQDCLWINLEYLSAESWVEGCHGLPSLQANGVPKFFFFPGFTPATGGLLREPGLLAHRDAEQAQARGQRLQSLTGLPSAPPGDALCALLFCYPDAPLAGLQTALAELDRPVWLLVPGGRPRRPRGAPAAAPRRRRPPRRAGGRGAAGAWPPPPPAPAAPCRGWARGGGAEPRAGPPPAGGGGGGGCGWRAGAGAAGGG